MKYLSWIAPSLLLATTALVGCGDDSDPDLPPDASLLPDGGPAVDGGGEDGATPLPTYNQPESARWDADRGVWYVSNISGEATGADGVGWITLLDAHGAVKEAHWVEGLDAPKGMALLSGTLYVADIDDVVVINPADGTIIERVEITGSQLLNDVAADEDSLYITDTLGNAIYRMQPGETPELFLQDETLKNPNGVIVHEGKLIVGSVGDLANPSDLAPLWSIDLTTKEVTQLGTLEGKLDGIELDGNRYIVSDFRGQIHTVRVDGGVPSEARDVVAQDALQGSADIGFDPVRRIVAIPDLVGGDVVFVSLDYEAPESAIFDEDKNVWYVSNIGSGGDFAAKDGNGFISRLDGDGNILEARWVDGLDAPKGMALLNDTLYVADNDQIIPIDIDLDGSGSKLESVPVDGAQFLNDVAAGNDGFIYFTDTAANAIHRMQPDQDPELFLQNDSLKNPNGILVDGSTLIVGSIGSLTDNEDVAPIWSIDIASKAITQVGTLEGKFDGLAMPVEGAYVVSDFRGVIHTFDAQGTAVALRDVSTQDYLKSAADLGYDPVGKKLAVPDLLGNSVIFVDLAGIFRLP